MKKLLLPVFVFAAMTAQAVTTIEYPDPIWQYKFLLSENTEDKGSSQLQRDWIMWGDGQKLSDSYAEYWAQSSPWVLMNQGLPNGELLCCSSSILADKDQYPVNDWLVFKTPVKMTYDRAVLSFNVEATQFPALTPGTLTYAVNLSTTGTGKDDFTADPIVVGTSRYDYSRKHATISGLKDQDVYIAFRNISKESGVLGYGDFTIFPYGVEVANLTPEFVKPGTEVEVKLNVSLLSPGECNGFTAVLSDADGEIESLVFNDALSSTDMVEYTIVFDNKISLVKTAQHQYTVTITPNYENAPSTVVNSEIIATLDYRKIAVVEEGTGTWCGYCPRGTAFLEYYGDKYPGQFIGIAVHAGSNDPMQIEDLDYVNGLSSLGAVNYPNGLINRQKVTQFVNTSEVPEVLKESAPFMTKINMVEYDANNGKTNVKFSSRSGFESTRNINMAAVVIEDDVTGSTSNYGQQNYYSGTKEATIARDFGSDWWPYFQRFCEGATKITASKMVYQHVARGIFPSFKGELLSNNWEIDTPIDGNIEFDMPKIVNDVEKTEVIILMLDADTNEVLSADRCPFKYYNKDYSGVAAADASEVVINREGDMLRVSAQAGDRVAVYAADGTLLAAKTLSSSSETIDGAGFSGIVIVKVSGVSNATGKMLWK